MAAGTGEPRRPGSAAAGGVDEPIEATGGRGRERVGLEPVGERSVEVVVAGHAMDSLATVGVRSSASRAARRAVDARLSRDLKVPTGMIEDYRRLGIGQPEVVVDDEHGALLGGQATEPALQLVAHGGQVLGVAVAGHLGRGHVDLHDPALPDPPGLAIAGVDEQPIEPGVEAVGVPDGADVQPGGHERLLDGIGRQVVAAQDQPRGPMQPIEGTRGKRGEGVMVAVPGPKDEVSLHRTSGSWRPRWPRSPIMSRAASESFHLRVSGSQEPKMERLGVKWTHTRQMRRKRRRSAEWRPMPAGPDRIGAATWSVWRAPQ